MKHDDLSVYFETKFNTLHLNTDPKYRARDLVHGWKLYEYKKYKSFSDAGYQMSGDYGLWAACSGLNAEQWIKEWEPWLDALTKGVDADLVKYVANGAPRESIDVGYYAENVEYTTQSSVIVERYRGWAYMVFTFDLLCSRRCETYRHSLQAVDIYQDDSYDWPRTMIFFEKLTPETVRLALERILYARDVECELIRVCREAGLAHTEEKKPWESIPA